MRHVVSSVVALVALSVVGSALAQSGGDSSKRPGFEFGGSPKYDRPTVPKDASEERALASQTLVPHIEVPFV